MFRIEAHIPYNQDEITPFPEEVFNELEMLILTYSTGFSYTNELGAWYNSDGILIRNPNRKYHIDLSDPIIAEILQSEIIRFLYEFMKQLEPHVLLYRLDGPIKLNGYVSPDGLTQDTFPPCIVEY